MTVTLNTTILLGGEEAPSEFDYELIQTLIYWASQDQDHLRKWRDRFVGRWDQGTWGCLSDTITDDTIDKALTGVCGTSFCMAGQAVLQKGYRIDFGLSVEEMMKRKGEIWNSNADWCIPQEPTGQFDNRGRPIFRDAGGRESIRGVARDALGLTEEEANTFFGADNQIEDLKAFANGMATVRGLPIMFPDAPSWSQYDDSWDGHLSSGEQADSDYLDD